MVSRQGPRPAGRAPFISLRSSARRRERRSAEPATVPGPLLSYL